MTQGKSYLTCFLLSGIVVAIGAIVFCPTAIGQDRDSRDQEPDAGSAIIVADHKNDGSRKEIEPGVFLYGIAHRFSEIGQAASFDCSPDGKTVVFASGKLRFFDIGTNKTTDVVGVGDEVYGSADFSADGRFVFAQTRADGASFVRVFDAIERVSIGTIQATIDDATRIEHNEQPDFVFGINRLCISPDAKQIALCDSNRVQVRDVETGKLTFYHGEFGHILGVDFSPDGSELFVLEGMWLRVIDLVSGKVKANDETDFSGKRINAFTCSASRNMLVWVDQKGMTFFDLAKKKEIGSVPIPRDAIVRSIAFSDDGTQLVAGFFMRTNGGATSTVIVVDVDKRRVVKKRSARTNDCHRVRFSPEGESVLVCGRGIAGVAEVFLNKDHAAEEDKFPIGPSKEIVMHPNGESFLSRTGSSQLAWFESSSGSINRTSQETGVRFVEFGDKGIELLMEAINHPKPLLRMDYESGKITRSFSAKRVARSGGVLNQLGSLMRTGGPDFLSMHGQASPMATRWSDDGSAFHTLIGAVELKKSVDSANDYDTDFSFRYVQMDSETGKWLRSKRMSFDEFKFDPHSIYYAAIRQDGTQIAIGQGKRVFIVDTKTGETVADFTMTDAKRLNKVVFSPGQNLIAAKSAEGIWVWDLQTGIQLKHVEAKAPNHFAFSKDGLRIAVCHGAKSSPIQVFETDTWKTVLSRNRTQHDRSSLALSDDGKKLLIGLADCRIEMWDLGRISK